MSTRAETISRVYAWRHEVRGRSAPTLRISREVLDAYPPFVVIEHGCA